MADDPNPAKCSEPVSLRAWLIDALALAAGSFAVYHYRPDGLAAGLIIFVGAYTLAHGLLGLNWQSLRATSQFLLVMLTPALHLGTIVMAPTASIQGLVYTFLLPGIAQAYWLWELWPATGIPSHPLAVMCAAWLALLGTWLLAKAILRLQAMGSG